MGKKVEDPSLSFITDHTDDLYIQATHNLVITYINHSVEKHLLLPSETELIGTSISSLFLFSDEWDEFLSLARIQKFLDYYQAFIKRHNGTFLIGIISFQQIFNTKEAEFRYEICIHDSTQSCLNRILSEDNHIDQGFFLNTSHYGIWVFDQVQNQFYGSKQFYSIFGYIPGEKNLTLKDILRGIHSSDHHCIIAMLTKQYKNQTKICYWTLTSDKTKPVRFFQMAGQIITHENQPTRVFGIIQDLSDNNQIELIKNNCLKEYKRKNLELDTLHSQLLDMNRDLELRIQSRTQQVEALLNQKDEFIIQIGHDIRTPLTPLVAILPLLRKRVKDPQCLKLLDIAIMDVQSITDYVSRILALVRKNPFYTLSDITSIQVSEMLDQIITNHSYLIYQKSISIHNIVPTEFTLEMSPLHFEAIFNNIIGNAVKFSLISGTIEIVGNIRQENGTIEIIIRDDGIGIEKEDLPHIFEEFFQGDKSRHGRDSYGLGLSIAKRVITMYNGTIDVYSEGQGKGTTVTAHLPFSGK